MEKLKLLYKLSPILLVGITGFTIYVAVNCWQDEKVALAKVDELDGKIAQLNKQNELNKEAVTKREQEKFQANLEVKMLKEDLRNALKNNQCANELVPDDVVNWLRQGQN